MSIVIEPYKIGQAVRVLPGAHRYDPARDFYTVLSCNEAGTANPSYVIENADDSRRQRREFHDQLVLIDAGAAAFASPFHLTESR